MTTSLGSPDQAGATDGVGSVAGVDEQAEPDGAEREQDQHVARRRQRLDVGDP